MGKLNNTNPNHPVKGSRTTVEPIRSEKHIKQIKRRLKKDSPRDYLLFLMGINNGLRIGDMLSTRVSDVKGLKVGDTVSIIEQKTGKPNILMINKSVHDALILYFNSTSLKDDDYLFKSRNKGINGASKPITRETVAKMVKEWTEGIKGNYSTHSLRKTWAWSMRMRFGVSFEVICRRLQHSSPRITMAYLGISDTEVENVLLNEV